MLKNIGIGFSWIAPGFLTLLLSLPAGLGAQEKAPGGQGEPSGWLFRGSLGIGSVSTDYEEETEIAEVAPEDTVVESASFDSTSSLGFDGSVLLGGFVSDNVALHGSLGVFNSGEADIGSASGFSIEKDTISYGYSFIKGGASIYFGNDFYISPEIRMPLSGEWEYERSILFIGPPDLELDIEGDGFGFGLTFGKEWYGGNHGWGFGLFLAFVRDPLLLKSEGTADDISFTNRYTSIGISVAYK